MICDRFTDATVAYQGGGKGVSADLIQRLAQSVHPGLAPDQTLVFDCPFDVSRSRLSASGRTLDRFEAEEREFFDRVRAAYRMVADTEPNRVRIIDGSQAPLEVKAQVEKYMIVD